MNQDAELSVSSGNAVENLTSPSKNPFQTPEKGDDKQTTGSHRDPTNASLFGAFEFGAKEERANNSKPPGCDPFRRASLFSNDESPSFDASRRQSNAIFPQATTDRRRSSGTTLFDQHFDSRRRSSAATNEVTAALSNGSTTSFAALAQGVRSPESDYGFATTAGALLSGQQQLLQPGALSNQNDHQQQLSATVGGPIGRRGSTTSAAEAQQQTSAATTTEVEDPNKRNLFVAGLHQSVTDDLLQAGFRRFGKVLSAKVMLDINTGGSRGFGFVLLERCADAAAAMAALQGHPLPGTEGAAARPLQISFSKHKGENLMVDSNNVHVRNVPKAVTQEELGAYFRQFGGIEVIQARSAATGGGGRNSRGSPSSPSNSTTPQQQAQSTISPDLVGSNEVGGTISPTGGNHNKAGGGNEQLVSIVVVYTEASAARLAVEKTHGKTPFPQCTVPMLAKVEEPYDLRLERLKAKKQQQQQGAQQQPPASPVSIVGHSSPATVNRQLIHPQGKPPLQSTTTTTQQQQQQPSSLNWVVPPQTQAQQPTSGQQPQQPLFMGANVIHCQQQQQPTLLAQQQPSFLQRPMVQQSQQQLLLPEALSNNSQLLQHHQPQQQQQQVVLVQQPDGSLVATTINPQQLLPAGPQQLPFGVVQPQQQQYILSNGQPQLQQQPQLALQQQQQLSQLLALQQQQQQQLQQLQSTMYLPTMK